mgnify:CR=1 FL=1
MSSGGQAGAVEEMRFMLIVALLPALMFIFGFSAEAASPADEWIDRQAGRLPADEIEAYWRKLTDEYGGYFPETRPPRFRDMLTGGGEFGLAAVLKGLTAYFFHELVQSGKLLAAIVTLSVFSSILQTLQGAFERNAISKVAYAICYMVIIIIAVGSFSLAVGYARDAIGDMIHFMTAIIPLMLTLLASIGNVATVSVLHPLIVLMIHVVGTAIYTVVFPLLFFSAVLHIVSALSDKYKATQLADLLRSVGAAVLGVMLTAFLGVITVRGATAAVADGVTLRTAKYIAGNFVPVIGKMFTEAADSVAGASLLVKNAVGLAGVMILVLICAFPAMKILALALIYSLAGAIMQPLGESPIIECLQMIGKNLVYVFAALAAVGLMFFFAMTIIITSGNIALMMR